MADLLRRRAVASPRAVAVEAPGIGWSYEELDRRAERVAAGLRAARLGPGSTVAALLPVTPAGVSAVHGVPRAGLALAPAGVEWTEPELRRFLEGLGPAALLVPMVADVEGVGPEPAVGGVAGRLLIEAGFRLHRLEPKGGPVPTGAHTVLWTSGTGGASRAVPLTLANHVTVARGAARRLELGATDRWLASLALSHVGGLALVLRAAYTGARLVTRPQRFRAADIDRLAREGRITHASLVPAMLHQWLEERAGGPTPRGLRAVLVGGAPTPPALLQRALSAQIPVAVTYGLTEAASQVATAPPTLVRRKPGSAGPPLRGVGVRIVDGEIRVRGRSVMEGYVAPPAGPAGETPFDAEGWLCTGDLGELDDDGHLTVRGRLGDRIVTGGVNVDPGEIEAALDDAPHVAELSVTSVPDPIWGERVVAVAVPRSPAGLDVAALDRLARDRLSNPRRPRVWIATHALPRNANGKVDRAAVRRLAEHRMAALEGGAPC